MENVDINNTNNIKKSNKDNNSRGMQLIYSGHRFQCFTTERTGNFLHLHKEVELLYIVKGSMEVTIQSQKYTANEGDFVLIFPYMIHKTQTLDNCVSCSDLEYLLCTFDVGILPFYSHTFHHFTPQGFPTLNLAHLPKEVFHCVNEILTRKELQKESNITFGYLTIILEHLLQGLSLEKQSSKNETTWVFQVISYINNNFRSSISLDTIAQELQCNKYFISRNFKQNIGCSLDQYVNLLRLDYARNLLRFTQDNITDIAFESGFENISTFYRVFKNSGLGSPQKYRTDSRKI